MNYVVSEWFCVNRLLSYIEKTHFMLFTNFKSYKHPVIKVNNSVIQKVKATNFYGIICPVWSTALTTVSSVASLNCSSNPSSMRKEISQRILTSAAGTMRT